MIALPCVSPDGKPTQMGMAKLSAMKSGPLTSEEVSDATGHPMFRVRSGLRELVDAGYVKQTDDKYELTPEGKKLVS